MCETIRLSDGSSMVVCGVRRSRRAPKCAHPDCTDRVAVECDHPTDDGKTCDRGTCRAHAKPIDRNVDWCWKCVQLEARRGIQPRLAL
jgi:hypothetical protein